jgi:hypothetical protein
MRFYYYATERHDGRWTVRSSLSPDPTEHATRDEAIAWSRSACRRHWEHEGTPCGIRTRDADGTWVDEAVFGAEEADRSRRCLAPDFVPERRRHR